MPDPPALSDADILGRLRARFGLAADTVEQLALGYDADAWVYRVHAPQGDRFLKVRRGPVNQASIATPQLLADRGIPHLVAPIPTVAGAMFDGDDLAFILFPFLEGVSGGDAGMTATQWKELGATMRAIHDLRPTGEFDAILRKEDFVPTKIGLLREVEARIAAGGYEDDVARTELADFWRSRRDQIAFAVNRTEALAPLARDRAGETVICHGDIHAWNVLVTPTGEIVIVDWDSVMLAPRERDLMFVDGIAGGHAADPDAFYQGYGDVQLDRVVSDYYGIEWAVQDLAEFASTVFLDPDAGDRSKKESVETVAGLFAPGSEIDTATRSERGDGGRPTIRK
jgi:spectinomycin phosphotransferase